MPSGSHRGGRSGSHSSGGSRSFSSSRSSFGGSRHIGGHHHYGGGIHIGGHHRRPIRIHFGRRYYVYSSGAQSVLGVLVAIFAFMLMFTFGFNLARQDAQYDLNLIEEDYYYYQNDILYPNEDEMPKVQYYKDIDDKIRIYYETLWVQVKLY